MIHYTLLPEKEIQALKREYRSRLFIVLLFFISCAIIAGVISLLPSFMSSYNKEKQAVKNLQTLQEGRHERGTDNLIKELTTSNEIINRIKDNKDGIVFSSIISDIVSDRSPKLSITSLQLNKTPLLATTTNKNKNAPPVVLGTAVTAIIQGKAATRDMLIDFKKRLESDPNISNVELPVSDLAKSKDISFAIRLTIKLLK